MRAILTSRPDIEVCDEAGDGREAVDKAAKLKPDLIVLDLTMPVLGGFAAAAELQRLLPNTPILFYSMHDGPHLVKEAKAVGARGFVSKSELSYKLLDAVDALVKRNGTYFPSDGA
jgi:DNA-binding NarL/FixJ family response regulator